jgi:hypothetical protein
MEKQKSINLYHNDCWGYEIEQFDDVVEIRYFNDMKHRKTKKPDDIFELSNTKETLKAIGETLIELSNSCSY